MSVAGSELLITRAGVTGEDFLGVRTDPDTARVTISVESGLAGIAISLDRSEAEALRNALSAYLEN